MTFNGEKGKSFKELLMSVLDTNYDIKETNTMAGSKSQTTTEMSVESEHSHSFVIKDSVLSTYNRSYNTQANENGFESTADTSSIRDLEELENFIDSAYYIANNKETTNFAQVQLVSSSTPFQQRADENQTETQFIAFKGNIESQNEKLLTKVSEQDHVRVTHFGFGGENND